MEKRKLVVVDGSMIGLGDLSYDQFEKYGELTVYHTHAADLDEIVQRVGDADIVLGDAGDLPPGLCERCPNIKLICVMATGYDLTDLAGSKERGIPLCNVPSYGTHSVSQYAISLLLEICGQVSYFSAQTHEKGEWLYEMRESFQKHRLIELAGKTMGIVGFGEIGRAVGRVAKAMGMQVLAYNRSRCPEGEEIGSYVELDELLAQSDVLSLHAPLTEQTRHMIDRECIAKMKDGVILINNGRGALVDSAALADALHTGKVYAAGLDVLEGEPDIKDNPLLGAPRCLITPHISWLTRESRQRILDTTEDNIRAYLEGKPIHVVNGVSC